MANVKRTVDIIFNGKDEVSKVVKGISGSISQLDYVARTVADPLAGLGKSLLGAEGALVALTATGMALAIRESGKFGDSFNEISTLIHATDENLNQFRSNILDYGRDSKISIDKINEAIYTAISAGSDYKDALELLSDAEKLAIAGRAEMEPTMRLLATTLNAYGESTDAAQKYSDVFFKTVEKGLTTIPELADSLARVTGIASTAEIPIEDLMAAIAALTATGMSTEEAVTALRGAISNIINPSSQAAKYARELGVGFNAEALAAKGLDGVLNDVYKVTGGNVEAMGTLFGNIRGLNAALVLGADNSGKFKEALEDMKNVTGATQVAYEKMAVNFALINQNLANNIKATLIGLGDEIMDNYKNISGAIVEILKAINEAMDQGAFDQIFDAIDNFSDRVTDFLKDVAKALPEALEKVDYSGFIDSLEDLSQAFMGLFDGLDLTKPEDLARAIQNAVDIIEVLNRVTSGMVAFFVDIFNAIREGTESFDNLSEHSQKAFGEVLAGAMMVQKAGIVVVATFLTMQKSGVNFEDAFLRTVYTIAVAIDSLIAAFELLRISTAYNLRLIIEAMDIATAGFVRGIGETGVALDLLIKDAFKNMVDAGKRVAGSLDEMGSGFKNVKKQITESIKENEKLLEDLKNLPDEVTTEYRIDFDLSGIDQANKAASTFQENLDDMPKEYTFELDMRFQERLAQIEREKMEKVFPESRQMVILPNLETEGTEKVKGIIERELPDYRLLEIEARIDETLFKEETKRIESYLKFKAEVDVAEIQAAADVTEAAWNSINTTIEDTGGLIGTLFEQLTDLPYAGSAARRVIEQQIEREAKSREEALQIQKRLSESQIRYFEAKAAAIARGEGLITVQCEGLKPHLEAILWEIVETAQIRTNNEFGEFLQGM